MDQSLGPVLDQSLGPWSGTSLGPESWTRVWDQSWTRVLDQGLSSMAGPGGIVVYNQEHATHSITFNMEKERSTYLCHICARVFYYKFNLNRHLASHEKDGGEIKCSKCSKVFRNAGNRDKHETKCVGKLECKSCKKTFKFPYLMKDHRCKASKPQKKPVEKPIEKPIETEQLPNPKKHACRKCGKRFLKEDIKDKHEQSCKTKVICLQCNRTFITTRALEKHVCSKNKVVKKMAKTFRCKRCPATFQSRSDLYFHFASKHKQIGEGLHPYPWGDNEEDCPWVENGVVVDKELEKIYQKYIPLILRKSYMLNNSQGNLNFPLTNNFTLEQLMGFVEQIYKQQQQTFKINLCFGFILKEKVTGAYRYFVPYANEAVLDAPLYISKFSDLLRLKKRLSRLDITEYVQNRRPASNWQPHLITNVSFNLNFTDFPLGESTELPDFLKNKRSLMGLTKSYNGYHDYTDQLCLFRALTAFKHPNLYKEHDDFEEQVSEYYEQYRQQCEDNGEEFPEDQDEFPGYNLQMLPDFEKAFELNVEVYQLSEEDVALPIFKTTNRYSRTMYLNLWEHHVSLIVNIGAFCKKFQCRSCKRHFKEKHEMKRHEANCKSKNRIHYPGGYYDFPKSIFQELLEFGINVPEEDRYCEHFCVYDFESCLETVEGEGTDKLSWLQKHNPISVSVCSSIPGFTDPQCFIDPDPDKLLATMVDYMLEIQGSYQALAADKWGYALNQLEELIERWTPKDEEKQKKKPDKRPAKKKPRIESDSEEEDTLLVKDQEEFTDDIQKVMMKKLKSLEHRFQQYMNQLLVIGFNSSRYDNVLTKSGLAKHLSMEEPGCFTIKAGNSYKCLSSPDLKFIDILSFLPPTTNYKKFLKCYSVSESKGWFPYDWFKSSDLLDYPELPPFEAFYSPLKGRNLLEEPEEQAEYEKDFQKWCIKFSEAMVKKTDVNQILKEKPDPPDTAQERYQKLKDIWNSRGFTKFSQYVEYYNNLDTGPMCSAITKMIEHYRSEGIDILKSAISIPGIARQLLFKSAAECDATFSLFDASNADLHRTFNNNLTGGPSIIFNRHHKVGETFIRGNPDKPCRALIGEDANG